jgi:hypothetical protein
VDLRRLRHGEWIAGISGVVLLVSMFFDWYGIAFPSSGRFVGDTTANAWESFAVVDIFLAAAALLGIALFLTAATQRSPAVPQSVGALTVPVAFVAAILVLLRLLDVPGWESVFNGEGAFLNLSAGAKGLGVEREPGLYLGVAATLGVLVGAWRSIGDESFPRAATEQVEVTPLPAPKPRSEPATDE